MSKLKDLKDQIGDLNEFGQLRRILETISEILHERSERKEVKRRTSYEIYDDISRRLYEHMPAEEMAKVLKLIMSYEDASKRELVEYMRDEQKEQMIQYEMED